MSRRCGTLTPTVCPLLLLLLLLLLWFVGDEAALTRRR